MVGTWLEVGEGELGLDGRNSGGTALELGLYLSLKDAGMYTGITDCSLVSGHMQPGIHLEIWAARAQAMRSLITSRQLA
jgi:hypothetical protein